LDEENFPKKKRKGKFKMRTEKGSTKEIWDENEKFQLPGASKVILKIDYQTNNLTFIPLPTFQRSYFMDET
jgi:hypothetical protein